MLREAILVLILTFLFTLYLGLVRKVEDLTVVNENLLKRIEGKFFCQFFFILVGHMYRLELESLLIECTL